MSRAIPIAFVTGNANKLKEVTAIFGSSVPMTRYVRMNGASYFLSEAR